MVVGQLAAHRGRVRTTGGIRHARELRVLGERARRSDAERSHALCDDVDRGGQLTVLLIEQLVQRTELRALDVAVEVLGLEGYADRVGEQVADADSTLLITGETGVGKERLARAIHAESSRAGAAFVAVNCAAISPQLLESELFGHVAGAFTGAAADRAGVIEAAAGGTLFLDEIGEMPPELLSVLQRREVVRVGTTEPIPVDVRVIAATHRDVRVQIEDGSFREDLYYRLAVIVLEIPALRERREDIPNRVGSLIRYLRDSLPGRAVERVTPAAMGRFTARDWPGNVRELVNAVERAMLLSPGEELLADGLPVAVSSEIFAETREPAGVDVSLTLREVREQAVERAEADYLRALLTAHEGALGAVAEQAGISTRALYDRLKKYGLDRRDFTTSGDA